MTIAFDIMPLGLFSPTITIIDFIRWLIKQLKKLKEPLSWIYAFISAFPMLILVCCLAILDLGEPLMLPLIKEEEMKSESK